MKAVDELRTYTEYNTNLFQEIYMLFCGIQDCQPLYSYGPAIRDSYIFHVCTKGKGTFYSGESSYAIETGQGFLIRPDISSSSEQLRITRSLPALIRKKQKNMSWI